jgi:FtsH-binding integral membrane protein
MNENVGSATAEVSDEVRTEQASFMNKVYGWMCAGLVLTAAVGYVVSVNQGLLRAVVGNSFIFMALIFAELGAVYYLSRYVGRMTSSQAALVFLVYSLLNGLTFSVIFLVYDISSIGTVFLITAGTFGVMALYGYVTKTDLTAVGNIAFMGLIGLILASIANIFILSERADVILAYLGVAIFVALTAYDVQKIKNLNVIGNADTDADKKEAIMGALTLYLDFVNLFLRLLRILGRRRR